MPAGIFNPYVEKKKPKSPGGDIEAPLGDIRLDGDSYVLEFKELNLEDLPTKLGELLHDITLKHKEVLLRHGIDILPRGGTRHLEDNEVTLPTPVGHICVFVDSLKEDKPLATEVKVFRRIACALREVPRTLLKKHQVTIVERA